MSDHDDPYRVDARTCCHVLRMRLKHTVESDEERALILAIRLIAADIIEHEEHYGGLSVVPAAPRTEVTREAGTGDEA